MILFFPFFWVQRLTNSPGSAVWPFIFFIYCHKTKYVILLEFIGLIALITNLMTWATNGLALINGVTTTIKKALKVCFIIGLCLTGADEILALIAAYCVPSIDFDRIFIKSML